MANERKGKTYEALIAIALEVLNSDGHFAGNIFWNEIPAGMTIEPDFTIGPDINHPSVLILVTHSGSAKNSDMKFWRNIGELAEAKVLLRTQPRVYSVIFDAVVKPDLEKLQAAAFDGQLVVAHRDYGNPMRLWVDKASPDLLKDPWDKVRAIHAMLEQAAASAPLPCLVRSLAADLTDLLESSRPELERLWGMERSRKALGATAAQKTFVRRGLSKLLIFEDVDLGVRLYTGKSVHPDEVPGYVFDLGLAIKTLAGVRPSDPDARAAVSTVGAERTRAILSDSPRQGMASILSGLRNLAHIEREGRFVAEEYDNLCNVACLHKFLVELHDNPLALALPGDVPVNWPPQSVWLLGYLIELLKVCSGAANGYGYAQLGRDVVDAGWGSSADLANVGQFGGGLGLSAWIARKASPFRADLVEGVASVIANRLRGLGKHRVDSSIELVPVQMRRTLEGKLVTYRGFDPLLELLRASLASGEMVQLRSCFAQRVGLPGGAGRMTLMKVGTALINWQSASDAGRAHKKKELCGRAVGLRYAWDPDEQRFLPRPGVDRLILLLDGTWQQDDVDALSHFWDEIYYPNELELLASSTGQVSPRRVAQQRAAYRPDENCDC